jgi:CBS domain-containing protein
MKVDEVMTRKVEVIHPQAGLPEAAMTMRTHDVGSLPVMDGDRLVGILTDRDIATRAVAEKRDLMTALVDDVMTRTVVHVFEDQELGEAGELMATWQVRRLPVLDRQRRLVGILSLGDLAIKGRDLRDAGRALQGVSQPARPEPVG